MRFRLSSDGVFEMACDCRSAGKRAGLRETSERWTVLRVFGHKPKRALSRRPGHAEILDFFFRTGVLTAVCAALILSEPASVSAADSTVEFSRDIRPLLSNVCFTCHGQDDKKRQANLRLDTADAATKTLESGKRLIVPGKSAESELFRRITTTDAGEHMPPADSGKTLTPAQIELIRKWIDGGGQIEGHWSFNKPKRSTLPEVKNPAPMAIDRFIVARLEAEGLKPSPEADKTTLLRRVTYDLTGLPPTLDEIDAFLADNSPNAYEKLVDRLLESPQYGEHMSRYWLDEARYGDTHGLHLDNERSLWPYRDWVIRAFNENKRFDEFTIEQIAGDLLPNPTLEQRIATGFNRCNVTTSEGGSIDEEYRVRYAVDRVDTTSTVFLGLTMGCAVCHGHKFDPISQQEFYSLFAYFGNVTERPMDGNALLPPPVMQVPAPGQLEQKTALEQQITAAEQTIQAEADKYAYTEPVADTATAAGTDNEEKSLRIWEMQQKGSKNIKKSPPPDPIREIIKLEADKRNDAQKKQLRDYYVTRVYSESRALFDPLNKQLDDLRKQLTDLNASIPSTMVMEDAATPRKTHLLVRGAYDKPGEEVFHGVPKAISPALPADAPKNRMALARWLVDPEQPLTARVTVNRWWQMYFGTGIVKTAEDFGAQGEYPSHPQLLDWLAVEFMESGWNVKHMQKLIVMSATYRQSSRVTPELYKVDRENRLLARGPRFRLDAEAIRDTALSLSGLLVRKIGGRSVKPYQPPGLWEAVGYTSSNTAKFKKDEGEALYRRSMYTFWKRTSPPPSMTVFDAPSREACTVNRGRTNTPLQALTLMNDEQYVEASRAFAERLMKQGGSDLRERITYAFRLATARRPTDDEMNIFVDVFQKHLADYTADVESARKLIEAGDSAPNNDMNPSELAAWTMVANLILNLDETVTKG